MRQPPKRIHDVNPRLGLDRSAFVLTFLIGMGGGLVLKLNGAQPILAAAYSAVVLLGYAFVSWRGGRLKLDPESIGDNCYYLGFLFTLGSLAVTLYQVASPATGTTQADVIPSVISGFGVALSSTIVGVFLRVLMMQMRPDFVAVEHEARTELSNAIRDFRTQLATSTRDMKSFAVESIQHAVERDARLRSDTEGFIKRSNDKLVAAQEALLSRLEEAATKTAETISEETAAAFERTASSLEEPLLKLGKTVDRLERSVATTERNIANFHGQLARANTQTDEFLTSVGGLAWETDESFKKLNANLSRAATRIENKTIPALETLEERLDLLPSALKQSQGSRDPRRPDQERSWSGDDVAHSDDLEF